MEENRSVSLTDHLELTHDLVDQRPSVHGDVGVIGQVVKDDDGSGCADIHRFLRIEEPGLGVRRTFPDVTGYGCILCEHVENVCYLFDFVCHGITAGSECLELFLQVLDHLVEDFLEVHRFVFPDAAEIALDPYDKIIVLFYKLYVAQNLFHCSYPRRINGSNMDYIYIIGGFFHGSWCVQGWILRDG